MAGADDLEIDGSVRSADGTMQSVGIHPEAALPIDEHAIDVERVRLAVEARLDAAQRALGFDYVFDANFSADLTIMEEGHELLHRLKLAWGLEKGEGELSQPVSNCYNL